MPLNESLPIATEFLASIIGIAFGGFYIQRLVNREQSEKDTLRWIIIQLDELEEHAYACWTTKKEDQYNRNVLAAKIKASFTVVSAAIDRQPTLNKKEPRMNQLLKNLFDASTGENFEFDEGSPDSVRPIFIKIASSCAMIKKAIVECL